MPTECTGAPEAVEIETCGYSLALASSAETARAQVALHLDPVPYPWPEDEDPTPTGDDFLVDLSLDLTI